MDDEIVLGMLGDGRTVWYRDSNTTFYLGKGASKLSRTTVSIEIVESARDGGWVTETFTVTLANIRQLWAAFNLQQHPTPINEVF